MKEAPQERLNRDDNEEDGGVIRSGDGGLIPSSDEEKAMQIERQGGAAIAPTRKHKPQNLLVSPPRSWSRSSSRQFPPLLLEYNLREHKLPQLRP